MKASTLIKELQSKIDQYGDLPVTFDGVTHAVNVGDVTTALLDLICQMQVEGYEKWRPRW